ncbi:OmpA family protein [uncultured Sphingomonas sp.]|uniref:OmpA family protein n=1 Tax=uncultured Sphingomonas sp. TaxID=158754 RepID=UPI0035CC8CE1
MAPVAIDAREPAGVSQVGPYLAGTEAAPRTFVFERLNFASASSAIRPVDQAELAAIATTLNQYPNSRVRVVGYADARGSDPANAQLGQSRADAVKAALTGAGIAATRIDTGTGGEADPVDTNATAPGRAENRRTELVVLQR